MNFNGFSFPHPVLGLGDDYTEPVSSPEITIDDTDSNYYKIQVKYNLDNEVLKEQLNNNLIAFLCEVTCTATLFREIHITNKVQQEIQLSKLRLRNKTELKFLAIAQEDITNFNNPKFNRDFNGFNFNLDKGDIVAYFGVESFIAGITYSKLKAVSSFMEIVKGAEEIGPINISLDNNKIRIELSTSDYDKYCDNRIGKNFELASTFHSSIVFPSLIHALHMLLKNNNDYENFLWAQVINQRIENEFSEIAFEEPNIPRLSQKLLGMPIARLIEDLLSKASLNNDQD